MERLKIILFTAIIALFSMVVIEAEANHNAPAAKYWIVFKSIDTVSKAKSSSILNNPFPFRLGLPFFTEVEGTIDPEWMITLERMGIPVEGKSKYTTSVYAKLTPEQFHRVSKLSFVKEVVPVKGLFQLTEAKDYNAPHLLGADSKG